MSSNIFTTAEVESLTSMLDKNFGFKRPASQTVGYSGLSDGEAAAAPTSEGSASVDGSKPTPGGVAIPAMVVNQTLGLPAPALSREAQAIKRAQEATQQHVKPRGNAIWTSSEVAQLGPRGAPAPRAVSSSSAGPSSAEAGGREEPKHEVLYKQIMSAEDVYLGADFTRDGSSALSDGVVVKISLPKAESAKEFELAVQPFALILQTKDYYLKAHLPTKVVEGKASAKWDATKKLLTVSLTADNSDKEIKMVA